MFSPCSCYRIFPFETSPSLYAELELTPLAPFGAPVWNPFLNFRGTSFIYRIRPVPVVFLLLAFMPQLSISKVTVSWEFVLCRLPVQQ